MASGTAKVNASSGLNVRKGAGTKYSKIGWLANGTKINYQSETNGWLKFNYNGKNGYVSKKYTSITSASTGGNSSSGASNANGSVKITASSLNVRKGAGTGYGILGTVSKNQVYSYSAVSNGWYKISYKGQEGWISGKYAVKTSSSGSNTNSGNTNSGNTSTKTTTMYVTASSLNVRKGAGTGYGILGTVKKGTAVAVRKTADGWHQINYGSGTGWVSAKYISKTKPSSGSSNNNNNNNAGAADTSAIPKQSTVRKNNSVYGHVDSAGSKLVSVNIPYKMYYGDSPTTVKVHKAVKTRVENIFAQTASAYTQKEIEELGLNKYSGCYNKRKVRGGSSYSIHSWGVAIDIDAGRNPMKSNGREPLATQKAKKFWEIVEANGGHSMGRNFGYDWMHFQFATYK